MFGRKLDFHRARKRGTAAKGKSQRIADLRRWPRARSCSWPRRVPGVLVLALAGWQEPATPWAAGAAQPNPRGAGAATRPRSIGDFLPHVFLLRRMTGRVFKEEVLQHGAGCNEPCAVGVGCGVAAFPPSWENQLEPFWLTTQGGGCNYPLFARLHVIFFLLS